MDAVPIWFAAGVTRTVRLAPLPPNTILAFGTSTRSDDAPERVRLAALVSASPIVNGIGGVAVSSTIVLFAMLVSVGASLAAVTVTVNERTVCARPSLTVTLTTPVPHEFGAVTKETVPVVLGLT